MPFVSLNIFNNRSIWLYYTLSECQSGGVIAQLLKTHILVPPSIFSKYFFFGPRPSLQKITNANTNTKIIFWRQTKTDKMTCIFSSGDDYKSDTLSTACWHLADTFLTPCWHPVGHFSNVQLYDCDNLTVLCIDFLPLQNSFAITFFHCKMFSCKVDFSICRDLILSSDFPNVHGDYWALNSNIDCC